MILNKLFEKLIIRFGGNESHIKILRKKGVKVGDGCIIVNMPSLSLGSEPFLIELGNNVKISSFVQFINHDGGVHVLRNHWSDVHSAVPEADLFGRIKIGNNVFVGASTIIMPGVTIGDNVIIGAGSIVTKDIASNSVACGVPARVIKSIEEYYEKNKERILYTKNLGGGAKKRIIEQHFNIK